jgi:hypothetical protein
MAKRSSEKSGKGIAAHGGNKKAPPRAGPGADSGRQSGQGRRDQRSGDALAQTAAPAKGGASTEQGQGAGNAGCGWAVGISTGSGWGEFCKKEAIPPLTYFKIVICHWYSWSRGENIEVAD